MISKSESTKSVLGRSRGMRPIASNYSEKLKHDSFVLLYFFVCFYFVLYFNTCVNIFVLLKAPGEERPRLIQNISQFDWTTERKLHPNISFQRCFCLFQETAREIDRVRMCFAHLNFVSEHKTQRSYTGIGVHV